MAALLVAAYHFTAWGVHAPRLVAPLIRHGYLGVDLFFVLSGFVMALTYGDLGASAPFPYRLFVAKRLRRIYPLYAASILATFLCVRTGWLPAATPSADSVAKLGIDLLMLQCLGAGASLLPVAWSLSTEWIAYLAFPVLARVALHRGRIAAQSLGVASVVVLLGLCAVPASALHGFQLRTVLHQPLDHVDLTTPFPLLRCLAGFCTGLLAWRVCTSPRWRAATRAWHADLAALCCFTILWAPWADYVVVPAFAVLLCCLGGEARPPHAFASKLLASRPVHWLGDMSYALYLTHLPVWQLLHPWTDRVGLPPLLLTIPALALAFVCHNAIEAPGRRALSRLFRLQA